MVYLIDICYDIIMQCQFDAGHARIAEIPLVTGLFLTSTGIFVYSCVPGSQYANLPEDLDQMMPCFVASVLPAGISGLFIAGIPLAVVLRVPHLNQSLGQGVWTLAMVAASVIALVVALGLYVGVTFPPIRRKLAQVTPEHADDAHYLRVSRYTTVFWGLLATVVALFVGGLGQIYLIATKVMGFWTGPLLGIFLLGLFTRRANATGAIIGAVVGTICTYTWASQGFTAWMYAFVGLVPTLTIGYLVSLSTAAPKPEQLEGMTIYTRFPQEREE